LIAPGCWNTIFFDEKWSRVGSKWDLRFQLSLITRIDADVLSHVKPLSSICVAHKMSWAANRETTRIEDMAYCLLGLFDVNMPLLYGEESKAFRRLQEEIIRTNPDLTIFAWQDEPLLTEQPHTPANLSCHCGILARTPFPFRSAGSLLDVQSRSINREFSVCNLGVKTQSIVFRDKTTKGHGTYILPLWCLTKSGCYIGIRLRKIGTNSFVRESPFRFYEYKDTPSRFAYISKDNYILIDKPTSSPLQVWPHFLPTMDSWTNLNSTSHRQEFLSIDLAAVAKVYTRWGCFDQEDEVFFVAEGAQTDCAGMSFSIEMPENDLGLDTTDTYRCVLYAIGWSKSYHTIFTVLDAQLWRKDVHIIQQEFGQGSNTPDRWRAIFNHRKIPRVSSIVLPTSDPDHKILICLRYLPALRKICVSHQIKRTEHIAHEVPEWGW
jgi:hypothetical protein